MKYTATSAIGPGVLDWRSTYECEVEFVQSLRAVVVLCFDEQVGLYKHLWFESVQWVMSVDDSESAPEVDASGLWNVLTPTGRLLVSASRCELGVRDEPFGDVEDELMRIARGHLGYTLGALLPGSEPRMAASTEGTADYLEVVCRSLAIRIDGIPRDAKGILARLAADAGVPYEAWRPLIEGPEGDHPIGTAWAMEQVETGGVEAILPIALFASEGEARDAAVAVRNSMRAESTIREVPIWGQAVTYLDSLLGGD